MIKKNNRELKLNEKKKKIRRKKTKLKFINQHSILYTILFLSQLFVSWIQYLSDSLFCFF